MNGVARRGLWPWLRILAALLSGSLLAWSYGLDPWWGAAWIAPIPLLVAVRSAGRRTAIGLGALAGAVASVSLAGYLTELGGLADALTVSAVRAGQWAVVALAVRAAMRWMPASLAVFVLPTLMSGMEVVTALVSPHGSGGSLAYSQMDALPVIQVAALGGTAAVVFLPMLFASASASASASAVAFAVVERRRPWRVLAVPSLILVLALGFGGWRVSAPPANTGIPVALIAADRFDGVPDDWREVWSAYVPAIKDAAGDGARIVVLPEKLFAVPAEEIDEFLGEARSLSRDHGVDLVIGVDERGEESLNRAYVVPVDGAPQHYDKRHLIPGFESRFSPGSGSLVTQLAGVEVGIAICKDMDFPDTIRGYGTERPVAMLVPAWDFGDDAWFHSRIAMLRGVENGTTIVRSAREGLLTVSDYAGRVLEEAPSTADPRIVLGRIPEGTGEATPASTIGDGFGWLCLVFALGSLTWIAWRRRNRRASQVRTSTTRWAIPDSNR